MFVLADEIRRLKDEGVSENEIAWRLGVAPTTVSYHLRGRETLRRPPKRTENSKSAPPPHQIKTRELVKELLSRGHSRAEVARQLNLSKATISYHARRLGEEIDRRCSRRYDWEAIQRYYDEGHSISECQLRFGFARASWSSARKRGDVTARPRAMPVEQLLSGRRNRNHIKRRLLALGLKANVCERCGINEWRGCPLPLALHHVNGDRHDNRLENLELLCGNCHSQTETFAGRNRPRPRGSDSIRRGIEEAA